MTKVDLMTGRQIPDALLDLGVAVGHQPVSLNQSRIVIAGYAGTGKSSLLHNNPGAFVLDIEGGGRTVVEPHALRWPNWETRKTPPTFDDYAATIRKVIERKVAGKLPGVEMLGVDGFDALLDLWKRDSCKKFNIENINDYRGGYGKGYDLGCETLFGLLDEAYRAGLGWCLLIHLVDRTINVNQRETVQTTLAVPEKFRGHLDRIVEHTFYLEHSVETITRTKKVTVGDKQIEVPEPLEQRATRRLSCTPGTTLRGTQSTDPKVRVPMVASFTLPRSGSWGALESEYNAALSRMSKPV